MKNIIRKTVYFIFAVMLLMTVKEDVQADSYRYWDGRQWRNPSSLAYTSHPIEITYEVKYCYEEAYKMIALVNAERRKAGVPEVEAKDELMDVAMMRAAETAIYWSHDRPDGSSHHWNMYEDGENLCRGAASATETNRVLVNSSGHYVTMVDADYAYAGYGCVYVNDEYYWVQVFSGSNKYYEDGYPDNPVQWNTMKLGERKDYTARFTAKINPNKPVIGKMQNLSLEMKVGTAFLSGSDSSPYEDIDESDVITAGRVMDSRVWAYTKEDRRGVKATVMLSSDQYDIEILTPALCSYRDGKVTVLKAGTARMKCSLKADRNISTTITFEIQEKPVVKGGCYASSGGIYKVTSTGKKTVQFVKVDNTEAKAAIPKTVKLQGKTYQVTSVAAGAFQNNKTVKEITIPAGVTSVGKNAFSGCSALKKITVKTTKLKSVGKNAFKGIHKKAVIKVPKKKLAAYKKLFKGKGQKKTVKIKK